MHPSESFYPLGKLHVSSKCVDNAKHIFKTLWKLSSETNDLQSLFHLIFPKPEKGTISTCILQVSILRLRKVNWPTAAHSKWQKLRT